MMENVNNMTREEFDEFIKSLENAESPKLMTHESIDAAHILQYAADEMQDRAKTYDKPEGERSMANTVKAFEAITGVEMTEQQGWQFMQVLKMVRSNQGAYRLDSFIDGAAYAALAGEAAGRDAN